MAIEPLSNCKIILEEYLKNTTIEKVPKLYAYSTKDVIPVLDYLKVGYTERENVDDRIKEQCSTFPIITTKEWSDYACFNAVQDGDELLLEWFHDTAFHAYLEKIGIERYNETRIEGEKREYEWFKLNCSELKKHFGDFKDNRGYVSTDDAIPYRLRSEQEAAVKMTLQYYQRNNGNGEFLWNAKPRFGKTLATYEFCKRIDAKRILILTNRPAVSNSWYEDYKDHIGDKDEYYFVSDKSLKNNKSVMTNNQFQKKYQKSSDAKLIEFISLQDLKGSRDFGGLFDKLSFVKDIEWDIVIIDETHEGVDTEKTTKALENLKYKFALHLSGTPYRQLANNKFSEDAIFSWTYLDEQKAKRNWKGTDNNPYAKFPKLNLLTYKMSDVILDKLDNGYVDETGNKLDYSFDLTEFFRVDTKGKFVHDSAVNKFLKSLLTQRKFPFSTPEMRNEIKHSLWLLSRNASVKALQKKLQETEYFDGVKNIFKDEYKIVIAPEEEYNKKPAYEKIKEAIANYDKTITLTVRKLTTGVTIPELTAILMLNESESPEFYMQSAFRAQTPCKFPNGTNMSVFEKQNAYIFDFNPARTLELFATFADKISSHKHGKNGDREHKENISELLNFFPVIGEDDNGEMIELDAEKVVAIPNQVKISSLFQSGFENSFLFNDSIKLENTSSEIIDIINKMTSYKKNLPQIPKHTLINIGLHPDKFGSGVSGRNETEANDDTDIHDNNYGKDCDANSGNVDETEKEKSEKLIADIRERIYGFSRLIPLFLMAYGTDDNISLDNFENYVPKEVFEKVSNITLDEFKQLRDDGDLFNKTLFNAAIKEFISTKNKLKNYLENDDKNDITIFDYIPPQQNNMVFTPKKIVKQMVDMLEEENPHCFDDPNHTFADLYMKSGLYIAEIVKRLYNSPNLKERYPLHDERLKHIFEKQVYGLAPTGIIYNIAVNYIMGFDENEKYKHNFKECDVIKHIKAGTLDKEIDRLYS